MAERVLVTGASQRDRQGDLDRAGPGGLRRGPGGPDARRRRPHRRAYPDGAQRDTRPLPGSVEETAAEVRAAGREALALRMDLTDLASVEAAIETLLSEWGTPDAVVHNGRHIGPGLMDEIAETPIEQYPLFVQAHAVSPIRITQMLLPGMIERGRGTVVMISSGAGTNFYPASPRPGLGYRLGKAAGHTLVGSVLAEYRDRGIRAFNVDPGFVLTERNSLDVEEFGFDPSAGAPPSAVGAAVAWLVASPEADELMSGDVHAQALSIERGLHPDWRTASR